MPMLATWVNSEELWVLFNASTDNRAPLFLSPFVDNDDSIFFNVFNETKTKKEIDKPIFKIRTKQRFGFIPFYSSLVV